MLSRRGRGGKKGNARHNENNKIYRHALPILLDVDRVQETRKYTTNFLGLFGLSLSRIEAPCLDCFLDTATRSVWVTDSENAMILWRRGFFGKGSLSRSEPSWYTRQVNQRKAKAAGNMTAEEVTAKRRAERQQFKLDRARALADAAKEAETVFASTGVILEESNFVIPSSNTWKPVPLAKGVEPATENSPASDISHEQSIPDEEDLVDKEHLQLTLPEAFFLVWTMGCLSVMDASTTTSMPIMQLWRTFQAVQHPRCTELSLLDIPPTRFDNPFIINYVVYHHYRSLGWVVRGGIKFCVDYLLYRRGPVFSHAEFALTVCPVYEDQNDRESCPYDLQNVDPFDWVWLSTINRANSQVQKTLIIVYVTIPALSRLSTEILASPACLAHYTIREVVVRRFIPARMRD